MTDKYVLPNKTFGHRRAPLSYDTLASSKLKLSQATASRVLNNMRIFEYSHNLTRGTEIARASVVNSQGRWEGANSHKLHTYIPFMCFLIAAPPAYTTDHVLPSMPPSRNLFEHQNYANNHKIREKSASRPTTVLPLSSVMPELSKGMREDMRIIAKIRKKSASRPTTEYTILPAYMARHASSSVLPSEMPSRNLPELSEGMWEDGSS